ncbi:MAG: DUF2818 family protein [Hydrogenophaga sp.]|jgi:hypothetical protein|nr:DUF2818 family protein [Hydrogenophaga sp.]
MSQESSVWLVLLAALVVANLPFLNERWLAVLPRRNAQVKSLGVRLVELGIGYFIVGGIGMGLEQYGGQIYPQGWEFYVTTGSLFLTLAFPGFVYRYLYKRRT